MLSPFKFIASIAIAIAPMTMAASSYAQQEVASDAGEVVLNATINAIDVENQLLTVTALYGNTIVVLPQKCLAVSRSTSKSPYATLTSWRWRFAK